MHLFLMIILVFCTGLASGQKKTPLVKVEKLKPLSAKPGQKVEAVLSFTVTKGFHVQANPASEAYLIPTTLTFAERKGVTVEKFIYPTCERRKSVKVKKQGACKPHRIRGSSKAIDAYDGTFKIKVPLKISKTSKTGKVVLTGKLRYQACDDHICFFPTSIPVSLPLRIEG